MLFDLLSTLLIGPLKLVFETIYMVANRFINHPGLSIIFLSLVMNILVLPLYRRADAMQEASRDTEARLHDGVAHIKKTFSGDERMMILQTYYRQNDYRPTDALNGSVSLLLEIPFFMAAYQFLSTLPLLSGVSLGPIADLSVPDALIAIGGMHINLLPILMTLINVISSAIYLKGFPLKTKIQLYGMALFFLVFLYTSPSGLVFYWTLNNLFSLIKTIFYKFKNPRRVLSYLCSAAGIFAILFALFMYTSGSFKIRAAMVLLGLCLEYPLLIPLFSRHMHVCTARRNIRPNGGFFFLCCLFLTVFIGVLIPSTYIAASPQEYINIYDFYNPLWYIVYSLCLAAGFFLIWMRVFYWLANPAGKAVFDRLFFILCGIVLINYMFFGTDLGIISANLQYETDLLFTMGEQLINLLILAAAALILSFVFSRFHRFLPTAMLTLVIALSGMSGLNIYKSHGPITQVKIQSAEIADDFPEITLSKNGKNVVVIMLDRALSYLVPYMMDENPELLEQFSGFTYYSNAISFGKHTIFGSPALMGGYEYTPVEINKRSDERLADKHNEATKVLPVAFLNEGYDVTVCDPPLANYSWIPDLSIFDEYPEIKRYITLGRFGIAEQQEIYTKSLKRNFFCFSLMKSSPLMIQGLLYNEGWYNRSTVSLDEKAKGGQTRYGSSISIGIDKAFFDSYSVLTSLPDITNIVEDNTNTYLFFQNETPHAPTLLKMPEYTPAEYVDNSEYNAQHSAHRTLNGQTLHLETEEQTILYQVNMATFLQLGNWFDHLKENGVYDNTRIILVSDHGWHSMHIDEISESVSDHIPVMRDCYSALLMMKDFDAAAYTTSDEFMTNADVPTMAVNGLIDHPENPFTGKAINSDEKFAHEQYITLSGKYDLTYNNGNTFPASDWASVHSHYWDADNWTVLPQETVLDEHSFDPHTK